MKNKFLRLFFPVLFLLTTGVFLINISPVHAVYSYTPMENIPGFENVKDFPAYVLSITKFAIWAVGIAALFMITVGGFMYMTAAGNTSRMDSAKKVIFDAVIGLIVVLSAWLLLYVINPDLVKVTISLIPMEQPKEEGAPVTPPTPGTAGTCQELATQTSSISAQCGDVSSSLSGLLACLKNSQPSAIINSISDNNDGVNCWKDHPDWPRCASDAQQNCCHHAKTSCHYSGSCSDGSHAVDISTSNLSQATLKQAGTNCGAKINPEGNHVHMSVPNGCCTL